MVENCLYIKVRPKAAPAPYTPTTYTASSPTGTNTYTGTTTGGGETGATCPSGMVAGSDGLCHKECGSGKYCADTATCYNGQCVQCPSGTTLGSDGLCRSPKKLLVNVLCDGVVFGGRSIPRNSKIYDDGSVDDPYGQPMSTTVDTTIWNQIKQTDGTCANTVTTGGGSENPTTPSAGGGGGSTTTGDGTASFITGEDDYKILATELTLADGTSVPSGSIIYRDGSVILPDGRQLGSGTVSCDTLSVASKSAYNCATGAPKQETKAGVSPLVVVAGIVAIGALGYYLYNESQKGGKEE